MFIRRNNIYILVFLSTIFLPCFVSASQAGIVIRKQGGQTKAVCVNFDSPTISGWQLLDGSGFNPVSKNGFIVEIDGERSEDSNQMSNNDAFWSYWKHNGSGWSFQNVGANYDVVRNGDIEGWELGGGICHLEDIYLEDICHSPAIENLDNDGLNSISANTQESESIEIQIEESEITESKITSPQAMRAVDSSKSENKTETNATTKSDYNILQSPVPGSVAGAVSSDRTLHLLPDFNLKNILFLLLIFISLGLFFILVKIRKKKHPIA